VLAIVASEARHASWCVMVAGNTMAVGAVVGEGRGF